MGTSALHTLHSMVGPEIITHNYVLYLYSYLPISVLFLILDELSACNGEDVAVIYNYVIYFYHFISCILPVCSISLGKEVLVLEDVASAKERLLCSVC